MKPNSQQMAPEEEAPEEEAPEEEAPGEGATGEGWNSSPRMATCSGIHPPRTEEAEQEGKISLG